MSSLVNENRRRLRELVNKQSLVGRHTEAGAFSFYALLGFSLVFRKSSPALYLFRGNLLLYFRNVACAQYIDRQWAKCI